MKFFHIFSIFFTSVFASQNYILITKQYDSSLFNSFTDYGIFYEALSRQYNLELFASIGDVKFYLTSSQNMFTNKKILVDFYDIEENGIITIDTTDFILMPELKSSETPWHLDRIVKQSLPLNGEFPYNTKGSCHTNSSVVINSYVVDTGIDIEHPEFEGRAIWSANFADEKDTDCNNHGTHVAGLIGSKNYGVCVDANLFAVKVLDCQGSGSFSGVIGGIEWVYNTHKKQSEIHSNYGRVLKSIINMSLGGGYSRAINRAVEACVEDEQDFYVVVAAGNENSDSCKTSPASVKNIITVMASDKNDNRAWFSNWGMCSNIYAPGVDVMSTIPDESYASYSGTSMASPVMVGVLNHYLDMYSTQNMKTISETIYKQSTKDIIEGKKPKTPNRLVYLTR